MGYKVLVVDDFRISRKILSSTISKCRICEFYEAENGQVAIEKFNEIKPDVVFLDITMPVMDGIECLKQLKQISPETPVIMCTADIQKKSIEKVMELGASGLVRKPPKVDEIKQIMLKLAKQSI